MDSPVYEALAQSQLLRDVQSAFRDATGLSLKLVPSGDPGRRLRRGQAENFFCTLMSKNARACAACLEIQRELQRRLDRKLMPQEICCFAGMAELAVPVLASGEHVATLVCGQVFQEKPSPRKFKRLVRQLREWGMQGELNRLEGAYLQTPVISQKQFDGAIRLLAILATQLADFANRKMLTAGRGESETVTNAKRFVNTRLAERVSLRETAHHVHLSRNYFCKVFKKATGMTFTEYVARVRVEKAKDLLGNLHLRITEVADRAGFNSISQFNRVFRRYTRSSPTAYRASLPTQ